jgi:hypothetical protein
MGFAPFELIYGTMPHMMVEIPPTELPGVSAFTQQVLDNLQGAHDTIIKASFRLKKLVSSTRFFEFLNSIFACFFLVSSS